MNKLISSVYVQENSKFGSSVSAWLSDKGVEMQTFNPEEEANFDLIDAAVIFHDNHNFDKSVSDLRDALDQRNVAVHKIDLSGTMNVALTHLALFIERTSCKKALFIGSESLENHPKMDIFKEKLVL
jgi:hypothetical protein